ncbi:MAG: class I SAM-dependent methyltransferase [Oscillospiraceae bacterium]|jgi:ubiquinone/menaquinone biosynthesis C-methylase UbiE|nr:class I SAM-dependent methyltransferase [Oscillospiraceae bacterium]
MSNKEKVQEGSKRSKNGYIKITHPAWLSGNMSIKVLASYAKEYASGRLIDIGCGTKPYEKLFAPYIIEHVGADHNEMFHNKDNVDIFADAYSIPVADNSFNSALSTSVLEHLEEPQKAFDEVYRILDNGGVLLLSVPFLYHLHEQPRDFYRYTTYGLQYLAENAGFKIAVTKTTGGFASFVATEIAYMIYYSTRFILLRPFGFLLMNIVLLFGWLFNKIDFTKKRLPQDYCCVFIKE